MLSVICPSLNCIPMTRDVSRDVQNSGGILNYLSSATQPDNRKLCFGVPLHFILGSLWVPSVVSLQRRQLDTLTVHRRYYTALCITLPFTAALAYISAESFLLIVFVHFKCFSNHLHLQISFSRARLRSGEQVPQTIQNAADLIRRID